METDISGGNSPYNMAFICITLALGMHVLGMNGVA